MSNAEFPGKGATKTFKQITQERLLKSSLIPVSELAKQKQEELDRPNAFTRADLDEEFVNRTQKLA